mgnify:CR=1 FL=1
MNNTDIICDYFNTFFNGKARHSRVRCWIPTAGKSSYKNSNLQISAILITFYTYG